MKIKDIGTVVTGKTPATSHAEFYGGDYMFVTPSELHGGYKVSASEKTITDAGIKSIKSNIIDGISVLVGCIGWDMGNVAMCFEKCATNQQINSVTRIKDSFNPYFLYYWLSTQKDYLFSIASVTRTPILSKGVFEEIKLPNIDRLKQDKISKMLLVLDRKIEYNATVNDNLQQQIKLMYDYWFNQFDFPNEDGKPYRSSGGKMQYSQCFKRNIPDGWTEESVISNSISTPIKPGVEPFSTKIYLATADVNGARLSSGSLIDYETREGRANMQPTVSSVWFAKMKNSIKHLFLNKEMESLIDSTVLSTGFCGLQCTNESFEYIAAFIEHSYFEDVKNTLAHGATQESVNNDDLLGLTMLVPTPAVLELFHAKARPLYAQISQNICENQKLTEIRDWLLPMLMNGQATIRD